MLVSFAPLKSLETLRPSLERSAQDGREGWSGRARHLIYQISEHILRILHNIQARIASKRESLRLRSSSSKRLRFSGEDAYLKASELLWTSYARSEIAPLSPYASNIALGLKACWLSSGPSVCAMSSTRAAATKEAKREGLGESNEGQAPVGMRALGDRTQCNAEDVRMHPTLCPWTFRKPDFPRLMSPQSVPNRMPLVGSRYLDPFVG